MFRNSAASPRVLGRVFFCVFLDRRGRMVKTVEQKKRQHYKRALFVNSASHYSQMDLAARAKAAAVAAYEAAVARAKAGAPPPKPQPKLPPPQQRALAIISRQTNRAIFCRGRLFSCAAPALEDAPRRRRRRQRQRWEYDLPPARGGGEIHLWMIRGDSCNQGGGGGRRW